MLESAEQIAHSGNSHGVCISLCLNNELSTPNWIRIKDNCVNTAIMARPSNLDVRSGLAEFAFEQFANQMFKILPIHCGQIHPFVQRFCHLVRLNESLVFLVKNNQRRDRRH